MVWSPLPRAEYGVFYPRAPSPSWSEQTRSLLRTSSCLRFASAEAHSQVLSRRLHRGAYRRGSCCAKSGRYPKACPTAWSSSSRIARLTRGLLRLASPRRIPGVSGGSGPLLTPKSARMASGLRHRLVRTLIEHLL